jgi:hypothetical protein
MSLCWAAAGGFDYRFLPYAVGQATDNGGLRLHRYYPLADVFVCNRLLDYVRPEAIDRVSGYESPRGFSYVLYEQIPPRDRLGS